jgi:hypothetical protein
VRWRTLFALLFLVAGLLWLWRLRDEQRGAPGQATPEQVPLFRDFVPHQIRKVRIDNLERAVQVTLERDAAGAWFLTEPLAYPGEESVVEALFRTLALSSGDPVGGGALSDFGLDPPKVVLECTQAGEEGRGDDRVHRMEVGAVDLDRNRIYARVREVGGDREPTVLLATRAIYSTLDRNPDDYRNTRATHIAAEDVTTFRRGGSVNRPEEDGPLELAFEAELGSDGWRRRDPPVVSLDPTAMGLVARASSELRAQHFTDDAPRSWATYGLDQPVFWIELETVTGESVALDFGHRAEQGPGLGWPETWYFRRRGFGHVWQVESADLELLVRPASDLFDYFLVRARREDIQGVELTGRGRTLVLAKETNHWTVAERRPGLEGGADVVSTPITADASKVLDVLSAIESTELMYPFEASSGGADASRAFVPAEEPMSISVQTADGRRWGGAVGAVHRGARAGVVGRHFLRFGDELSALIEEQVGELCLLPVEDFQSDRIHLLRQENVYSVILSRGETSFAYIHPNPKSWIVEGSGFDAPRDFTNSLVTLLGLRAERWLQELDGDALLDAIDFRIVMANGTDRSFRLGRTQEGVLVWTDGQRSAEVSRDLLADHLRQRKVDVHEALFGLFD